MTDRSMADDIRTWSDRTRISYDGLEPLMGGNMSVQYKEKYSKEEMLAIYHLGKAQSGLVEIRKRMQDVLGHFKSAEELYEKEALRRGNGT